MKLQLHSFCADIKGDIKLNLDFFFFLHLVRLLACLPAKKKHQQQQNKTNKNVMGCLSLKLCQLISLPSYKKQLLIQTLYAFTVYEY